MTRTDRARVVAAWSALAVVLAPLVLGTPAAAGGSIEVGEVTMSADSGGSATDFTLELPDGAACPGDSANDGYRVQSYMVPASVDPTTVTYNGTGPIPSVYGDYADFRQPLYDIESNSFVSAQTADAVSPGQPGPILEPPTFDLEVYGPGQLPAGRYHLGLACTLLNEIATVWDTEIVVADAPDDAPAQISWTAVGATGASGSSSRGPAVAVVLGAAALGGLVLLVRRPRRSRSTPTPSLEDA
jgi:hypothetical protein